jgi:hypothetical protein
MRNERNDQRKKKSVVQQTPRLTEKKLNHWSNGTINRTVVSCDRFKRYTTLYTVYRDGDQRESMGKSDLLRLHATSP